MSVQTTPTHRAQPSNDLNDDEHGTAPTNTPLPTNPPNLTWPDLTEPPRGDDGQASANQLKLNDTDKIGVQNAGRQSSGSTGGRQRFGAFHR
jgi:hypothetical protein